MAPSFPHTQVKSLVEWSNYSGTIAHHAIPLFCTPDPANAVGSTSGAMVPQGESIRSILAYCFSQPTPEPVRALGSRWSFSRIIEPSHVVIDPPNLNVILRLSQEDLTDAYKQGPGAEGRVPVFVEAGTTISAINRRLGQVGLALQTSGAGDGHRLAGCIATGTHGSALGIGAVHDTVLGVHLVVSPERAVFVQSASSPACVEEFADWLTTETGIVTQMIRDDDVFGAALVSLGSMGFVFSVVLETVPLYRLERATSVQRIDSSVLWKVIGDLDTSLMHPDRDDVPYHFDIVMHPYPEQGRIAAYATCLWKASADGVPFTSPDPLPPDTATDNMGLIGSLSDALGVLAGPLTTAVLQDVIGNQLETRYGNAHGTVAFPGEYFGPTTLPPGNGASTEIVVDHADAERAIRLVLDVLDRNAAFGRHLLGAIGIRFVPRTKSLLGMNIADMNCYIELPSIRNKDVLQVYADCWKMLRDQKVGFTCHWGQLHGLTPDQITDYFGDRAKRWKAARQQILDERARVVFGAPLLAEVGLHV
jgi:hypothetical protein